MAHTIANGYSLFKKRTVLCESLRVTTEKTGLDWFSRSPLKRFIGFVGFIEDVDAE